jgi:hypothetical protein
LRSIDLRDQDRSGYRFAGAIRSVPTFVLVDASGIEIDRVRGYPGSGSLFCSAIDRMLAKADRGERAARSATRAHARGATPRNPWLTTRQEVHVDRAALAPVWQGL